MKLGVPRDADTVIEEEETILDCPSLIKGGLEFTVAFCLNNPHNVKEFIICGLSIGNLVSEVFIDQDCGGRVSKECSRKEDFVFVVFIPFSMVRTARESIRLGCLLSRNVSDLEVEAR